MTVTYTDDYLIEAIQPAPEMTAKVNPELMALRFPIPRWAYAAASNTSWKRIQRLIHCAKKHGCYMRQKCMLAF